MQALFLFVAWKKIAHRSEIVWLRVPEVLALAPRYSSVLCLRKGQLSRKLVGSIWKSPSMAICFPKTTKSGYGFSLLDTRKDGGESHAFSHEISPLNLDSKMLIFYYEICLGFIIKDMDIWCIRMKMYIFMEHVFLWSLYKTYSTFNIYVMWWFEAISVIVYRMVLWSSDCSST